MAVRKQSAAVRTQSGPGEVAGPQIVNGLQTFLAGFLAKAPVGGAGMELLVNEEEISVDPAETTVYSTKKLLPAASILLGVTARVTEEILDEVYAVGGMSIAGVGVLDEEFMIDNQGFVFKHGRIGQGWINGVASPYAVGQVAVSGPAALEDTLTVGDQTYTVKPIRTGAGEVTGLTSPYATGTFEVGGAVTADTETFTIGTTVYTFKAARTGAGEVTVGVTPAETAANMIAAINLDQSAEVVASLVPETTTVLVTAVAAGAPGLLALAETTANVLVSGAFLAYPDVVTASDLVDNLIAAINLDQSDEVVATRPDLQQDILALRAVAEGAPGELATVATGAVIYCAEATLLLPVMDTATLRANIITAINLDLADRVVASEGVAPEDIVLTSLVSGTPGAWAITNEGPLTNITFTDFELPSNDLSWTMGDEDTPDRFGTALDNRLGAQVVYTGHWDTPAFEQEMASSIGITTSATPFTGKVIATVFALKFHPAVGVAPLAPE